MEGEKLQNGVSPLYYMPIEIWCHIFSYVSTIQDLRNIVLTCTKFHLFLNQHHTLWKHGNYLKQALSNMAVLNYPIGQPTHSSMNELLITKNSIVKQHAEEILLRHIYNRYQNSNLTLKYYAREVLVYARKQRLETKWETLVKDAENVSFLECAVVISQWLQKDEKNLPCIEVVEKKINDISNRVREVVRQESAHQTNRGRDITLERIRVQIILKSISFVFFQEMKFEHCHVSLDDFDVEKVLLNKKGIPMLLCLLYREISKQFRVRCDIISIGRDFYIGCQQIADLYLLINVGYKKGGMYKIEHFGDFIISPDHPIYFFDSLMLKMLTMSRSLCSVGQMGRQFAHKPLYDLIDVARLSCTIASDNTNHVLNYGRLCMEFLVQLEEASILLQKFAPSDHPLIERCRQRLNQQQSDLTNMQVVHGRKRSSTYQIGDVVMFNAGESSISCVITGYSKQTPPLYEVLINNGNSKVILEDLLSLHPTGRKIVHPKIGIYFDSFDGRRYIGNTETQKIYPN